MSVGVFLDGMLCHWAFPDFSRDCFSFIFRINQSMIVTLEDMILGNVRNHLPSDTALYSRALKPYIFF
jgi:hypothetical protein